MDKGALEKKQIKELEGQRAQLEKEKEAVAKELEEERATH
jgi:hypothetical protein